MCIKFYNNIKRFLFTPFDNYFLTLGILSANHGILSNDYPIFTIAYLRFIPENLYREKLSALHH